jgi:energy-coupling factor transporter ATP-binding protein EcfA2
MIHSVRFRNFKALRNVEIELDRLTVLVGPNASGKTSVLEGIHHLTRVASVDPKKVFEGPANVGVIASRGAEGVLELAFSGSFRRKRGDLSVSFAAIEDYPFSDTFKIESRWGDRRYSMKRELSPPEDQAPALPAELPLGLVVREAAYLKLDIAKLAEPSYSDLPTPVIGPDGSGLAAVVADMAVARPDDFGRLQEALRAVIPGLVRVRLVRARVPKSGADQEGRRANDTLVWGHEIVFDMVGATDIPARAASEGLLLALGLFAVLMGPDRQELVLVDHLERGLHPRAFGDLVTQLVQVLTLDPRLQIVAVTDSPTLLDQVSPENVRVHCLLEDGSARVKPLTLHPEFELLRSDLQPGEFWTQVGDAWVAEEAHPPPLPPSAGGERAAPPQVEIDVPAPDAPPGTRRWPPTMPPLPGRA